MSAGRSVSIKDVARRAGVAISTASLALNGGARVAPETLRRIQDAATELNYVGNRMARRLKRGRSGVLGVTIFPGFNECHFELAFLIQEEARKHGYATRFFFEDLTLQNDLVQFFGEINGQIDGLISYSGPALEQYRQLAAMGIPCVFQDRLNAEVDFVAIDFRPGARLATEYLLGRGFRKIATFYTGDEMRGVLPQERLQGYIDAMTAAGLEYRDLIVEFDGNPFVHEDLYELSSRILKTGPEAVFIRSDFAALTLLRVICDHGLRPGKDIAVVGFDNIKMGRYSNPSLTTIDYDQQWRARKMVEILLARIDGAVLPAQHCVSKCRLVKRESA